MSEKYIEDEICDDTRWDNKTIQECIQKGNDNIMSHKHHES